jgi:hypothetical protein
MDDAKIIDLAAWRAAREKAVASPHRHSTALRAGARKARFSSEALQERQREVIEKLRALGYEMSQARPGSR